MTVAVNTHSRVVLHGYAEKCYTKRQIKRIMKEDRGSAQHVELVDHLRTCGENCLDRADLTGN